MRASIDGTARPVTVVDITTSTSCGRNPASSSAAEIAAQPSSTAFSIQMSVALPKSVSEAYSSSGSTR